MAAYGGQLMPNRMIRESCRTSPTLDALSAEAERLFWRLTTVADDFGRFEADPRVLLAQCFPLKAGTLKPAIVGRWFQELVDALLVTTYADNGKPLGFFVTWAKYQHVRAKRSKYPAPTDANICSQMRADASVSVVTVVTGTTGTTEQHEQHEGGAERASRAAGLPAGFARVWAVSPKRVKRSEAVKAYRKLNPDPALVGRLVAALQDQRVWPDRQGQFFPNLASWLNGRRWEDEPPTATGAGLFDRRTAGNLEAARIFLSRTEEGTA